LTAQNNRNARVQQCGSEHSGLEIMARLGYAARGLVNVIVGGFALVAAFEGRRPVDAKGALEQLLRQPLGTALLAFVTAGLLCQPLGTALLAFVAAGLLCFAAWRLAQAFLDAEHEGNSREALARRAVYVVGALIEIAQSAYRRVTAPTVHDVTARAKLKES